MPEWKDEVRKRLSRLNLEPAHEAEIVEELAQHLEDVYQRSLRAGATEAEATMQLYRSSPRTIYSKKKCDDLKHNSKNQPLPVDQQTRAW